jgi:hypothetical protein
MGDQRAYIEELMDLKQLANIRFRAVEGGVTSIRARIKDIINEGGRDILTTDAGFSIGMDQILEINGRSFENYC